MLVVRKPVADPPIDVTERHLPGGAAVDGGRDEVRVAVRWLGVVIKDSSLHRGGRLAVGRRAVADETSKSAGLDVEPAEPVHLGQAALERVLGAAVHVEGAVGA